MNNWQPFRCGLRPRATLVVRALCLGGWWLIAMALGNFGCTHGAATGEIYLANGLEQLALGDTTRALVFLKQARWELGNDHRVLFHIGRIEANAKTFESRVRARKTLLQAIDRAPDTAEYRQSLGALLQRQRYPLASTRMLARAVLLDPGLSGAWLLLGENLQSKYFLDMDQPALLDSAMQCYANAVQHGPTEGEAAYRLAFLHMHRGMLDAARDIVAPIVAESACPGRFGMLLTAIEYRSHQYGRAAEVAARTLECMDWPQREKWIGLQAILQPDRTSCWQHMTATQRDSMTQWFWWQADPTPTTLRNERLLEHLTRVVEASAYFEVLAMGKTGNRTDRGEMWQRYGEPMMQFRLYGREESAWRWVYGAEGYRDRGAFFDFVDVYHNDDYLRVRRGSRSDFSYPLMLDEVPVATRIVFTGPPGGMQYQMRYFRGSAGHTAVEIAFAVRSEGEWQQLVVEAAGWRGPQDRAAYLKRIAPRVKLYKLDDGRLLGRLRFEVPSEELVLGLQATAIQEDTTQAGTNQASLDLWVAMGRDTLTIENLHVDELAISDIMLAYSIEDTPGELFQLGGVQVIPRVDARITDSGLNLYFEIYASQEILRMQRRVAVRYAVRARRPESFGFWEQFKPGARHRWDPDNLPSVQASYFFIPQQQVEPQHLHIDLSVLKAGPYELRVELEDPKSGAVASRIIPFLLEQPRTGT